MRFALVVASLASMAAARPANTTAVAEQSLQRRGACREQYGTFDYCAWSCKGCVGKGGTDLGCWQGLCINGCQTAIGFDSHCTSHWNDGSTFAYKCDYGSDGTFGMSRWKLKEMGMNCWGGNGGAGEEFWCQC